MDIRFSLDPVQMQMAAAVRELETCNEISAHFGLILSTVQMQSLVENRFRALKNTGRVEFGEGIIKKLVYAFCDSPFISQVDYESTLIELQDIFYYFKNESMERLSDNELIEAMKSVFDGKASGSLEYLAGTSLETLCHNIRYGTQEELWEDEEGDDDDE